MVTAEDAVHRRVVRTKDGRTARLFSVPGRKRAGAKARVTLPGGAILSVPVDELEVVE